MASRSDFDNCGTNNYHNRILGYRSAHLRISCNQKSNHFLSLKWLEKQTYIFFNISNFLIVFIIFHLEGHVDNSPWYPLSSDFPRSPASDSWDVCLVYKHVMVDQRLFKRQCVQLLINFEPFRFIDSFIIILLFSNFVRKTKTLSFCWNKFPLYTSQHDQSVVITIEIIPPPPVNPSSKWPCCRSSRAGRWPPFCALQTIFLLQIPPIVYC